MPYELEHDDDFYYRVFYPQMIKKTKEAVENGTS